MTLFPLNTMKSNRIAKKQFMQLRKFTELLHFCKICNTQKKKTNPDIRYCVLTQPIKVLKY